MIKQSGGGWGLAGSSRSSGRDQQAWIRRSGWGQLPRASALAGSVLGRPGKALATSQSLLMALISTSVCQTSPVGWGHPGNSSLADGRRKISVLTELTLGTQGIRNLQPGCFSNPLDLGRLQRNRFYATRLLPAAGREAHCPVCPVRWDMGLTAALPACRPHGFGRRGKERMCPRLRRNHKCGRRGPGRPHAWGPRAVAWTSC